MVTVKRYNDKFLNDLAKCTEQACPKPSGNDDNATTVVGVYEILPTNCMRRAYYQRKKLAGLSAPWLKIPYAIRGRAIEAAIARILFAHTGTTALERHKRYENAGIVCYTLTFPTLAHNNRDKGHKHRQAACSKGYPVQRILGAGPLLHGHRRKRGGSNTFDKLLFQRAGMTPQRF